jgi:hypothetical protein
MLTKLTLGHFVIVINRMMGDASDEDLYTELLTIEPGDGADVQDRNAVRYNCNKVVLNTAKYRLLLNLGNCGKIIIFG